MTELPINYPSHVTASKINLRRFSRRKGLLLSRGYGSQLGKERWTLMLAAWVCSGSPCKVRDFGPLCPSLPRFSVAALLWEFSETVAQKGCSQNACSMRFSKIVVYGHTTSFEPYKEQNYFVGRLLLWLCSSSQSAWWLAVHTSLHPLVSVYLEHGQHQANGFMVNRLYNKHFLRVYCVRYSPGGLWLGFACIPSRKEAFSNSLALLFIYLKTKQNLTWGSLD